MFAPSNTYTTKTKRKTIIYTILCILTLFTLSPAEAQDKFKIRPLQKTSIRRFQYDIYAYASGGINDAMSLSVLK